MTKPNLTILEKEASDRGLLLRIQVRRPFNIWSFRLVVGEIITNEKLQLWGEMKGWAYQNTKGLQLDIMKVGKRSNSKVGDMLWAATMAWALESTPCRQARLLAIFDDEKQHARLTRYFKTRKFLLIREVSSSLSDLPLRMVWGGAGSLMVADCSEVLEYSSRLWQECTLQKN